MSEQTKKEYGIDKLRRAMVAAGLTHESAGIAVGLAAEYAMDAHCSAYSRGYEDGHRDGMAKAERKRVSLKSFLGLPLVSDPSIPEDEIHAISNGERRVFKIQPVVEEKHS